MPLTVCLHNIRSTYNVGAILRTLDGFGATAVLSGYTPRPHDADLLPHLRAKLDREIKKTALGAEDSVPITAVDDISAFLASQRLSGWQVLGLENNLSNVATTSLYDSVALSRLGERRILVLGEEVAGIDPALYSLIDVFLEIPMQGSKESFNVSVAAGIALFALSRG